MLSDAQLSSESPWLSPAIIFHYFGALSARQQEQFRQMGPIYKAWNQKLNLISRQDIDYFYLKHVLHALSIAKVVRFGDGANILDVGTGGGFPGIPLAIMFPQTQFHLVDSIGKKIKVVQLIADELELTNVTTSQIRAEKVVQQYDFVLGRAVIKIEHFYVWVKDLITPHTQHSIPHGILYLQGNAHIHLPIQHHIYPISQFFDEPFFEHKQLVHLIPAIYPKF